MRFGILLTGIFLVLGCVASDHVVRESYPKAWWEPVDPKTAPSWEILPQAASLEKNEVILSKRNELGILSNFADTPFTFRQKSYGSVEGFWQALKFPEDAQDPRIKPGIVWPLSRDEVALKSGFEAKDLGKIANENMKKLGIKWVTFEKEKILYGSSDEGMKRHYELIVQVMREKLAQNPQVKQILLKTGSLRLLPDHDQGASPPPAYRYHEIWMMIREELKGH